MHATPQPVNQRKSNRKTRLNDLFTSPCADAVLNAAGKHRSLLYMV